MSSVIRKPFPREFDVEVLARYSYDFVSLVNHFSLESLSSVQGCVAFGTQIE